jgi:MYXO-CTERM domain-containing protein
MRMRARNRDRSERGGIRRSVLALGAVLLLGAGAVGLSFLEVHRESGLAGAFGVAVSPDGQNVYAVGYDLGALLVYGRNPATGALTWIETHRDGNAGVDGLAGATSVAVTADGTRVYATGFDDDALAVFTRSPATGQLTFVDVAKDQGQVDGLGGAEWVALSPDGAYAYVAASNEAKIGVFAWNGTSGQLDFVQAATGDGLLGVSGTAVSPDGAHVYATGFEDDAVVVFSRNTSSGQLTRVQTLRNGAGVQGLLGALGVAVSPDGANVYVAGNVDNAIAVFSRDPGTGMLSFQQVVRDSDPGVDGLSGADAVAVSADGLDVYATGCFDDALVLLSRNPITGALSFRQVRKDTVDGDGLFGAVAAAVSPDAENVYVAAQLDGALSVFQALEASPTATASPTASATATPTPTPTPTSTGTGGPPTPTPTATASVTASPSATPSVSPTPTPTPEPSPALLGGAALALVAILRHRRRPWSRGRPEEPSLP